MQDELAVVLGRKVDLLEEAALRNPYRRSTILHSKHVLYAA
jgi:predicted nucleotidyltransferase